MSAWNIFIIYVIFAVGYVMQFYYKMFVQAQIPVIIAITVQMCIRDSQQVICLMCCFLIRVQVRVCDLKGLFAKKKI